MNKNSLLKIIIGVSLFIIAGVIAGGVVSRSAQKPSTESVENSVVEDTTKETEGVGNNCAGSAFEETECVANGLVELAEKDPGEALKKYSELAAENVNLVKECHAGHHILGGAAISHSNLDEVLRVVPDTCGYGFLHGATDTLFNKLEYTTLNAEEVGKICLSGNLVRQGDNTLGLNCAHGAGHWVGNQAERAGDVGRICQEAFKDRRDYLSMCTSGGFMEHIQEVSTEEGFLNYLRECSNLQDVAGEACVDVSSGAVEVVLNMEPLKIEDACSESGKRFEKCARAFGVAYALKSVEDGGEVARNYVEKCSKAGRRIEKFCILGGVVIVVGAGRQGVFDAEKIEQSLYDNTPETYHTAILREISETSFLQGVADPSVR